MEPLYPVIDFHQFGSNDSSDRLLLFTAKAKDLAAWAGIPRKGWRVRMLFQRWITSSREREVQEFWDRASTRDPSRGIGYVLGPTAIVVAIQGEPAISNGRLSLFYNSPIDGITSDVERLRILANLNKPKVVARISETGKQVISEFERDPIGELPNHGHDYVLEFALQLIQMAANPEWFIEHNSIPDLELRDLIIAMEALCRPAIVVDGQHRLWGAQGVGREINLPVVAMTSTDWTNQIYQFVVINEKAQKVDSEILNDIFASSLTPEEQEAVRTKFSRVKVDIEQRIAGVLAGRDATSPFYQMVSLNLPNPPAAEANAYITQNTIQALIEGGRGTLGWRSDDKFYETYIKPTFPDRDSWQDWRTGHWRRYWFAFWNTVRDTYRPQAKKLRGIDFDIWDKSQQSNLTKGVGLKVFQRFFMETVAEQVRKQEDSFEVLKEYLDENRAKQAVDQKIREKALPPTVDEFVERIRNEFLAVFPVRFFTASWEKSLDDQGGQDNLLYQMKEAFKRDNWRARGGGVFVQGND